MTGRSSESASLAPHWKVWSRVVSDMTAALALSRP